MQTTNSKNSMNKWLEARDRLGSAIALDVLDSLGHRSQALSHELQQRSTRGVTVGRAKTLLWLDFAHDDPKTYALELAAVDSIAPHDLVVCATGNSPRSGIWGELLTTAAIHRGAVGIVTDGAVRDVGKIEAMNFPVHSKYISPYDSYNRQKVVAYDINIEIDAVLIRPGDIIIADQDGVAVVPFDVADKVLEAALKKAKSEDLFRDAVKSGSSLVAAYEKYHVL